MKKHTRKAYLALAIGLLTAAMPATTQTTFMNFIKTSYNVAEGSVLVTAGALLGIVGYKGIKKSIIILPGLINNFLVTGNPFFLCLGCGPFCGSTISITASYFLIKTAYKKFRKQNKKEKNKDNK